MMNTQTIEDLPYLSGDNLKKFLVELGRDDFYQGYDLYKHNPPYQGSVILRDAWLEGYHKAYMEWWENEWIY